MNSYLLKVLSGITSASIEKYLVFAGWIRDMSFPNPRMMVFYYEEDPTIRLAVPANEHVADFFPCVYSIIQTLSVISDKPEQEIIDSIKSAYMDRLQFRIITEASKQGKIPLDYAARCIDGLKDLVLYAACAEENAKPVCTRTNNMAKRSLGRFQLGQTQIGSFIINVDVQVADEDNEQLHFPDFEPPPNESPEHKVIKRIGTAIEQVERAVNRQIKISELVENAYEDGITANMCDALSKLKPQDDEDITLETSIYYAQAITRTAKTPIVRSFDNIHFAVIDEISKCYRNRALFDEVTLEGTIKMLSKTTVATECGNENTVRLLSKVNDKMRSITLHLSPENHTLACDAYRDDKEVRVSGTIDMSGKLWFFSEVTEFIVL